MSRDEEPPKRRTSPETKAQNLIQRFPIVDLAQAVFLTGTQRRNFLNRFVSTFTTMSYAPTRAAYSMIYAAQGPLIESPPEPWSVIERHIMQKARSDLTESNLTASRELFDLVRSKKYVATQCDVQVLRVAVMRVVPIDLSFYITDGDRLVFQFPLVRREFLDDEAIRVLGSVIHHAYAQGDYEDAEIEIADIGCLPKSDERCPRIRPVPRSAIYDRQELNGQIAEVYTLLAEIAARPRTPPDGPTPMGL